MPFFVVCFSYVLEHVISPESISCPIPIVLGEKGPMFISFGFFPFILLAGLAETSATEVSVSPLPFTEVPNHGTRVVHPCIDETWSDPENQLRVAL